LHPLRRASLTSASDKRASPAPDASVGPPAEREPRRIDDVADERGACRDGPGAGSRWSPCPPRRRRCARCVSGVSARR